MSSSDKYGPARFQPGMLASRRWQEQALPKASNTAERLLAASISMREFVGKIEHHVQVSYGQEYRAIAGPLSVNQGSVPADPSTKRQLSGMHSITGRDDDTSAHGSAKASSSLSSPLPPLLSRTSDSGYVHGAAHAHASISGPLVTATSARHTSPIPPTTMRTMSGNTAGAFRAVLGLFGSTKKHSSDSASPGDSPTHSASLPRIPAGSAEHSPALQSIGSGHGYNTACELSAGSGWRLSSEASSFRRPPAVPHKTISNNALGASVHESMLKSYTSCSPPSLSPRSPRQHENLQRTQASSSAAASSSSSSAAAAAANGMVLQTPVFVFSEDSLSPMHCHAQRLPTPFLFDPQIVVCPVRNGAASNTRKAAVCGVSMSGSRRSSSERTMDVVGGSASTLRGAAGSNSHGRHAEDVHAEAFQAELLARPLLHGRRSPVGIGTLPVPMTTQTLTLVVHQLLLAYAAEHPLAPLPPMQSCSTGAQHQSCGSADAVCMGGRMQRVLQHNSSGGSHAWRTSGDGSAHASPLHGRHGHPPLPHYSPRDAAAMDVASCHPVVANPASAAVASAGGAPLHVHSRVAGTSDNGTVAGGSSMRQVLLTHCSNEGWGAPACHSNKCRASDSGSSTCSLQQLLLQGPGSRPGIIPCKPLMSSDSGGISMRPAAVLTSDSGMRRVPHSGDPAFIARLMASASVPHQQLLLQPLLQPASPMRQRRPSDIGAGTGCGASSPAGTMIEPILPRLRVCYEGSASASASLPQPSSIAGPSPSQPSPPMHRTSGSGSGQEERLVRFQLATSSEPMGHVGQSSSSGSTPPHSSRAPRTSKDGTGGTVINPVLPLHRMLKDGSTAAPCVVTASAPCVVTASAPGGRSPQPSADGAAPPPPLFAGLVHGPGHSTQPVAPSRLGADLLKMATANNWARRAGSIGQLGVANPAAAAGAAGTTGVTSNGSSRQSGDGRLVAVAGAGSSSSTNPSGLHGHDEIGFSPWVLSVSSRKRMEAAAASGCSSPAGCSTAYGSPQSDGTLSCAPGSPCPASTPAADSPYSNASYHSASSSAPICSVTYAVNPVHANSPLAPTEGAASGSHLSSSRLRSRQVSEPGQSSAAAAANSSGISGNGGGSGGVCRGLPPLPPHHGASGAGSASSTPARRLSGTYQLAT